jgi:predicted  nucleic acid-binding Zn-ribbon protein
VVAEVEVVKQTLVETVETVAVDLVEQINIKQLTEHQILVVAVAEDGPHHFMVVMADLE